MKLTECVDYFEQWCEKQFGQDSVLFSARRDVSEQALPASKANSASSAEVFSRLLDGFRSGWLGIGAHPFVLEFAAPLNHPVDPSFGRRGCTYEYVGSACLPIESGNSVDAWGIVKWEPEIDQSIEEFRRLSCEAGVYLPAPIRDWVGDYHWPADTDPASWWASLLTRFYRIPGTKIDEPLFRPKLIEPWLMSIDVIEKLRLNTDSPRWPQDQPSDDEQSLDLDLDGLAADAMRLGRLQTMAAVTKQKADAVALNDCEAAIVQALHESGQLKGEELAAKAGYPYNSHFKATLSSLRKRGITDNTRGGYSLLDIGRSLAQKSGLGQD